MERIDKKRLMNDLFNADGGRYYAFALPLVLSIVRDQPTIEAEPKHGRWRHYEGTLTCSECHAEIYDDIMVLLGGDVPRYCPLCGADMQR